ncbi:hypothetical protein AK830_g11689 [Neonectria ditissima]|uniref:Uncharacterized protein n=1 Tax=Neonectria ditissima TaxID=78410 RepID=A0A0P7AQU2_9HYPO|nr:hypothetical protein AK830_g11689 [Neonectria ditissima]
MPINVSPPQLNEGETLANTLRQSRNTQRTVSTPGWVKTMLPSNRPERGGTARERGFWEQFDPRNIGDSRQARQPAPESRRKERSETADSSRLVEWNVPQKLSEIEPRRNTSQPRPRAASAAILPSHTSAADRKWSWAPKGDTEDWHMITMPGEESVHGDRRRGAPDGASRTAVPQNNASLSTKQRIPNAGLSLQAKREARKQRRSLKESGDYLGVQGFNPETGLPDVITPSDSEETDNNPSFLALFSKNTTSKTTKSRVEREISKIFLKKEAEKIRRREQEKAAQQTGNGSFRWRRQSKQWSSAQEPNLSPIAQSHRSGSSPSSQSFLFLSPTPANMWCGIGRQSFPEDRDTRRGLIDPNPPKSKPNWKNVVIPADFDSELYEQASRSSGTVVQTPHRQSRADVSPSGLELFKNGISFDNLDQTSNQKGQTFVDSSPDRPIYQATGAKDNKAGTPSARHLELPVLPTLKVTAPGNTSIALESNKKKSTSSFLGLQARSGQEPGEIETTLRVRSATSSASLPSLSALLKSSQLNQHFSPESAKRKVASRSLGNVDLSKIFVRDSTTTHPKLDTQFPPEMSPHLTALLKRGPTREPQGPSSSTPTPEAQHLPSEMEEMKDRDRIYSLRWNQPEVGMRLDLDDIPLTEEEIQDDLKRVRRKLASVDQPTLTMVKSKSQSEEGETWAQGAIRDITSKCDEFMDSSACTPTIITTGYDLQMSTSTRSPGQTPSTGHPRRRQLSRVIHNLPDRDSLADSVWSFRTNPTPNTSLNSEPPVETPATDIMSVRHLESTKQRTEALTSKGPAAPKPEAHPQYSTSHTSMFMARQDEPAKKVEDPNAAGDVRMRTIKLPSNRYRAPSRNLSKTKERQGLWSETKAATRDLVVHIPGSYPEHLLADDDIGGHSNGQRHENTGENRIGGL